MEKVTAMSESQLRRRTKRDTKTTQSHDCDAGLSELLKFPIFRGYAATKIPMEKHGCIINIQTTRGQGTLCRCWIGKNKRPPKPVASRVQ